MAAVDDEARDRTSFSARMTNVQFSALASRLKGEAFIAEVQAFVAARKPSLGRGCDEKKVAELLLNGWATERVLRSAGEYLQGDSLRHGLQWAFPQAYYSVYSVTLAYFVVVGYTERSHKGVQRKVATDCLTGRYPQRAAFAAHGGVDNVTFHNLAPSALAHTLDFEPRDTGKCDAQIRQFLNATREKDLRTYREDLKIRTKKGAEKKRLTQSDWDFVSERFGPTAFLHLLYRKRIKANYQNIETFLHPDLDADRLMKNLATIVSRLNWIHEVMIRVAVGDGKYEDLLSRCPVAVAEPPKFRRERFAGAA